MWPRPAPNRGTKPDFPAFELGSHEALEIAMSSFMRRLVFHYGIYRRYPLRPLPALKNAWRIARA